jgi:hypothetical protein
MEKIKTIDEHGSKMDFQNEKLKKLYVNYSNAFDAVGIHAAHGARMQFSRVSKDPRRAGSSEISALWTPTRILTGEAILGTRQNIYSLWRH